MTARTDEAPSEPAGWRALSYAHPGEQGRGKNRRAPAKRLNKPHSRR